MLSQLRVYGRNYFSYKTMIKQVYGGISIGNVTHYPTPAGQHSRTCERHQKLACVHSCDVILDNVPALTGDLLSLAVERGLVTVNNGKAQVVDKPKFPDGEFPNMADMAVYRIGD